MLINVLKRENFVSGNCACAVLLIFDWCRITRTCLLVTQHNDWQVPFCDVFCYWYNLSDYMKRRQKEVVLLLVFSPVVCCYQCFMFSLRFVLTRLVFFPVFLWWFLLGQQQYIFVKTFVQFPSLSRIVYSTLFLSGSVFTCVVHVYVLCGVITACVVCLVNHCGTSHIKCMYFWASCLVVGGHGGQTICASGYQVRLLDNTDT